MNAPTSIFHWPHLHLKLRAFFVMCKPRVNMLIVFTAIIGMLLSYLEAWRLPSFYFAIVGIAMVASAAAAFNCVIEAAIDAKMQRTSWRPLPQGEMGGLETIVAASLLGGTGMAILYFQVNPLTMWLTMATFFGYAFIYTAFLKPTTPMNIVIGGASGAMPPVLGWAAITGEVSAGSLVLFLIIFLWTPPHFWALACYRRDDYAKSGLPMLPITHGVHFTCVQIVLYTVLLSGVSLIPVTMGMSGVVYLIGVSILDLIYLYLSVQLLLSYSDALAKKSFSFSILYLAGLFLVLFLDRLLS